MSNLKLQNYPPEKQNSQPLYYIHFTFHWTISRGPQQTLCQGQLCMYSVSEMADLRKKIVQYLNFSPMFGV